MQLDILQGYRYRDGEGEFVIRNIWVRCREGEVVTVIDVYAWGAHRSGTQYELPKDQDKIVRWVKIGMGLDSGQ